MLGFPCSSLSGTLLRVTGPLSSLVLRTEDIFLPLDVHRFSVFSIKMLKTVHQRCVIRMRVTTMDVRMRLGDAIDPCHLANGFEVVIGYGCQERSNPP
ncbi:MAG: hypothetical protein ACK55Z_11400, partial [bacterium]